MEDHSINSVQVLSIDEERRKFRIIFTSGTPAAADVRFGKFKFNLPAPTALANSDHFRNARIKIENVAVTPDLGVNDATWALPTGGGQAIHQSGVIVRLGTPSSQTIHSKTFAVAEYDTGNIDHNGFMQFVPLEVKNVGSLIESNTIPPAAANIRTGGVLQRDKIAWLGDGTGAEGMICGNPFNQNLELSLLTPSVDFTTCYLASAGGAGALLNMIGTYTIQFIVEMIPNKGGC